MVAVAGAPLVLSADSVTLTLCGIIKGTVAALSAEAGCMCLQ